MSTTNNARGNFMFGNPPFNANGAGLQTPGALILPAGGRVVYLRSTGGQDGDPQALKGVLYTTLAAALAPCRSGLGDTVYVLPGHSESVSTATMLSALVAGTRVIGVGDVTADDAPTFRWTATTSQWAIAVKNCTFMNLRLLLDGANGVVKAINVTAAGTKFIGNLFRMASGATLKATIGIEVGSAALGCTFINNTFTGTETHNVTDGVKLVGATTPDDFVFTNNRAMFSATAGNGLVHVTVAAKRLYIENNVLYNTHTASTACIAVDNVAADGVFSLNYCACMNDGTATAQGIVFAGTATVKCFNNQTCDEPRKSGLLTPTVVT